MKKKVISILIALVISLSLASIVFADGSGWGVGGQQNYLTGGSSYQIPNFYPIGNYTDQYYSPNQYYYDSYTNNGYGYNNQYDGYSSYYPVSQDLQYYNCDSYYYNPCYSYSNYDPYYSNSQYCSGSCYCSNCCCQYAQTDSTYINYQAYPVNPYPVNYQSPANTSKQWTPNGSINLNWLIYNFTNENWDRSNVDVKCTAGCHLLTNPNKTLWDIPYTVQRNGSLSFTVNIWQPLYGEKMSFAIVAGSKTLYTFEVDPN